MIDLIKCIVLYYVILVNCFDVCCVGEEYGYC